MTIPPAHRRWLVIFAASVVVWVGVALTTLRSGPSITAGAGVFILHAAINGGRLRAMIAEPTNLSAEARFGAEIGSSLSDIGWRRVGKPMSPGSFVQIEDLPLDLGLAATALFRPFSTRSDSRGGFAIHHVDLPLWLIPLTVLIAWGAWTWRAKRRGDGKSEAEGSA